ncbi:MAG: hypothetical protein H6836_06720 [Planctomycetes bacterium]|nr:hypothetical protein [Planctomycetota bacterium]
MTTCTPELAEWRALRGDPPLAFRWTSLFEFGVQPAYVVHRVVYLSLLEIPGANFAVLRYLPWGLAVTCCLVFLRLLRRLAAARGERPDPRLLLGGLALFSMWIFSPSFGSSFLVTARFGVFAVPLCFLLALSWLSGGTRFRMRFLGAMALSWVAVFTDRFGVAMWIALIPAVLVAARRHGSARPWVCAAAWCLSGNLASVLCHYGIHGAPPVGGGLIAQLLTEPVAVFRTTASVIIGQSIPRLDMLEGLAGYANTSLLLGGLAMLLAVLWVRRRDPWLVHAATPWLACALFGLCCSIQVVGWFGSSSLTASAWMRELLWPESFLLVGVAGLLQVCARPLAAVVFPVGLGVFTVLIAADWKTGWEQTKAAHKVLRMTEAQLALLEVANVELPDVPPPPVPVLTAAELRRRGLLAPLPRVPSLELSQFAVQPRRSGSGHGSIDVVRSDYASGWLLAERFVHPPALVFLTRRKRDGAEKVFKIAGPNFYFGGRKFPWEVAFRDVAVNAPFAVGEEVAAYAFQLEGLRLFPLGEHSRWDGTRFVVDSGVRR